jgi:hypothetical protein
VIAGATFSEAFCTKLLNNFRKTMNRTKGMQRARKLTFVSFVLFVLAVVTAIVPNWGIYATLALVLFGGFFMISSKIVRDRASPKLQESNKVIEEESLA